MELIDRYVYAVTRHMPKGQRQDVAEELQTTIQDMAASHAKSGKPSKEDIEAILKQMGRPETLALKYGQGPMYLIGPKWFALYWQTLKQLVTIVPPIVAAVMLAVNIAQGVGLLGAILGAIGLAATVVVYIGFWVTLIFVVIERTGANPNEFGGDAWEPNALPELPAKRQVSKFESAVALATIAATALFAAGATLITVAGEHAPILNPALWQFWMPALLALLAAGFVIELCKFKIGNWVPALAAANVLLNAATVIFFVALLTTQQVINPDFVQALQARTNGDLSGTELSETASWLTGIAIAGVIASSVWSAGESVYKSWRLRKG